MADIRAEDLTQETTATLDGSEEFIMFDSTEGKRGSVDDVGDYILQNGDADGNGKTVAQMIADVPTGDTVSFTQTQSSGNELGKITINSTDTKIYSPTETDPVFSASAAAGISSSDITAWNGKSTVSFSQNQTSGDELGTITINGTGKKIYGKSYASKQDALVSGTNIKTINSTSILGSGDITTPDTHYTGYIRAGASGGTANAAASDPYLNYVENSTNRSGVQLKGGTNVTIASDANGVVTINSSGGGGGGGDTVSYTQTQTSGNELGTITINGTPSKIYGVDYSGKSTVSFSQTQTSGDELGTITINGSGTKIYGKSYASKQDALVSGTNIKTINNESLLGSGNITIQGGGGADVTQVSITVANWNATTTCTKSVTGVTTSNSVIVSPAPSSISDYVASGVYCSAQAAGTLTFTASSTPTADLVVNVMIVG